MLVPAQGNLPWATAPARQAASGLLTLWRTQEPWPRGRAFSARATAVDASKSAGRIDGSSGSRHGAGTSSLGGSTSSGSRHGACTSSLGGSTSSGSSTPAPDIRQPSGRGDAREAWPHVPVLLGEVLEGFRGRPVRTFLDGTVGAGGHTCAVLAEHRELACLIAMDVDATAHTLVRRRLEVEFPGRISWAQGAASTSAEATRDQQEGSGPSAEEEKDPRTEVHLVQANFRSMDAALHGLGVGSGTVDGILLDIGVSSMQIDAGHRGFSFLQDGPLDMRMGSQAALTAEDVVNEWPEAEVARVLRDFGEERQWRTLARRIVEARQVERITTTAQLAAVLGGSRGGAKFFVPRAKSKGGRRSGPVIHPATRSFQALRIAVNGELDALAQAIPRAAALLAPGGRLAIISFHSLEDRIVKHSFLEASGRPSDIDVGWDTSGLPLQGRAFKCITTKPIVASAEEAQRNARSRSAKLRILERTH